MKQEHKLTIIELQSLFHSGDLTQVKLALERIKELKTLELEDELLKGVKYIEANDTSGYWTFTPNKYFTAVTSEEEPWNMNTINGNLWFGLISLIGLSQCKTAVQLREQAISLTLFGLQMPELPAEIGNFSNLTHLVINNYFSGEFQSEEQEKNLPPEIGNLTKLIYLDMGQNNGIGLPSEIKNLTHLETLLISTNGLTSITPEICALTNLRILKLDNNQISNLPPEIGNLTQLEILEMPYNQLTTLPPEIGNLTKLETLDIGGNPLKSLPAEIGNLTKLTSFGLYNHRLTSLPSEINQLKNLPNLVESFSPWLDADVPKQLQEQFAKKLEQEHNDDLPLRCLSLGSLGYPKAVSAWGNLVVCATDENIFLYDASNFDLLWNEPSAGIKLLSFSRDGKFLLCVSEKEFIRRYDVSNGKGIFVWECETETMPTSLCLSHDGNLFAVCHQDGAGSIYIRECSDGSLMKKIDSEEYEGYGYNGLAFSADDLTISAGDQDWSRVRNWNVKTGKLLDELEVSGVQFCSVDYSICGKYLFTGTLETTGSVWDSKTKTEIMSLEDKIGITRIVAAHPTDGKLVATAVFEVLHVWNVESQELIAEFLLPSEEYSINTLSVSSEGFVCALVLYAGYEEQKKDSSYLVIASY